MKNSTIILIIIIIVLALVGANGCSTYNSLVEQSQQVDKAWSDVEVQYQRRLDLIPNLVETVKGYAQHESSTLEKVTELRSQIGSMHIDAANLTPEQFEKFQQMQNELTSALKSLISVTEAYPDLKANENFLNLQTQLEGTENRIATERRRFNEVVTAYNTKVRKFPGNIWAGIFGFYPRSQFQAAAGAENAPKVSF